jgi:hypothetical protein
MWRLSEINKCPVCLVDWSLRQAPGKPLSPEPDEANQDPKPESPPESEPIESIDPVEHEPAEADSDFSDLNKD